MKLGPRGLLSACLTLGALWLGWACLAQANTEYDLRRDPLVALAWSPENAEAQARVAAAELKSAKSNADLARAERSARAALQRGPMEFRALRVLGLAADRGGRVNQATRLMTIAGRRTPRDEPTQIWLFNAAVRRGDFTQAFAHADALLRVQPGYADRLNPILVANLANPMAVPALLRRLAFRPDWRRGFMAYLAGRQPDVDVAVTVFDGLHAGPAPPTPEETTGLINRLVSDHQYRDAKDVWARLLPGRASVADDLVYDGNFRGLPGAPPFNWDLASGSGALSELVTTPDGARALHVQFPTGISVRLAQQMLVLSPGRYRLSGGVRFDGAAPTAVLAWRVGCIDGPGATLVETRQVGGGAVRRTFFGDFVVPATGCTAQALLLNTIAQDSFATADAWFDNLSITPLPTVG